MKVYALAAIVVGALAWPVVQDLTVPNGVSVVLLAGASTVAGLAWWLLRRDRLGIDKRLDAIDKRQETATENRGALEGRMTAIEVRVNNLATEGEMERRFVKERHDTMEKARKHLMTPLAEEIEKLEKRVIQLERRNA